MRLIPAGSVALVAASVAVASCGGAAGSPGKKRFNVNSPNVIALPVPARLSAGDRAEFRAGEVVAAQAGCLACHRIGRDGNSGPGPSLTHVGSRLGAVAIATALRRPQAPMPSFAGLASESPKKFKELVGFISMLR